MKQVYYIIIYNNDFTYFSYIGKYIKYFICSKTHTRFIFYADNSFFNVKLIIKKIKKITCCYTESHTY